MVKNYKFIKFIKYIINFIKSKNYKNSKISYIYLCQCSISASFSGSLQEKKKNLKIWLCRKIFCG